MTLTMKRRTFIKTSILGLAGLTLGCQEQGDTGANAGAETFHPLNLYLHVGEDDTIRVIVVKNELGQGITTALPMIVADELEADWQQVAFEMRPEMGEYGGGFMAMTAGSQSIRGNYTPMRQMGAAAKEMLVAAAAARWGVDPGDLTAENSVVSHPSLGSLTYGELAAEAALLPVPEKPRLKDPSDFNLIGTSVPRLDSPEHIAGTSKFAIDTVLPNMLYAAVAQSPVFGGDVSNFDSLSLDSEIGTLVKIPNGLAVVSKSYWQAERALRALAVEFEPPAGVELVSSSDISAQLAADVDEEGSNTQKVGDTDQAEIDASKVLTAVYEVPFLAHSPLEPMNCTAQVTGDRVEIWLGTQAASNAADAVLAATGLDGEAISLNLMYVGGSFGRKGEPDAVTQAAVIAKAMDGVPVQVIWSRAEDMQHDFYRPAFMASFRGLVDGEDTVSGWIGTNAGPSIMSRFYPTNADFMSREGFSIPYSIPNISAHSVTSNTPVPVGFWRSIGFTHNTFFIESFIDELAGETGADPLAFRKSLLPDNARALALLDKVAEMSNWGTPRVPGAGQGVVFYEALGSLVAVVAEVTVDQDHSNDPVSVHNVYCAVDCGEVIHPNAASAQIEGAVIYGLTAALYGHIEIEDGRVAQSGFHDYRALTLKNSPHVAVEFIRSGADLGGIGETGTPGIAPAVTNAVFQLTGERIRQLPISKHTFG